MISRLFERAKLPLAVAAWCCVLLPGAVAAADCEATLDPELIREEAGDETGGVDKTYIFGVEVDTEADCAMIRFDLVATIAGADGAQSTRRKPGQVRLSNGSTHYRMAFNIPPDQDLVDWRFELTQCHACALDSPE